MTTIDAMIGRESSLSPVFILSLVALAFNPAMASDDRYPPLGDFRHSLRITESYEKIRDTLTTKLEYKRMIDSIEHNVDMQIVRFSRGPRRTKGEVSIHFFSYSTGGWKYLKFHDISFLVDGERWSFDPKHDGDVETGYVTESFWVELSEERFLRLVNSKSVDIALGSDKFSLRHRDFEALKDFASIVNSPGTDLTNRPVGPKTPRTVDRRTIPDGQGVVSTDEEERAAGGAISLEYFDNLDRIDPLNQNQLDAFMVEQGKQRKLIGFDFGTKFKVLSTRIRPKSQMEKRLGLNFDKRYVEAEILDGEHKGITVWFQREDVVLALSVPQKNGRDNGSEQAESKLGIAKSHDKDGRKKLAIATYKEVIEKYPDTPQAEQAKARLLEIDR